MIFAVGKSGQQVSVVLSPNAVARGGEAELFEVAEQPEQLAKVSLPKYRTEAKRDKINYLIQHNPNQIGDKDVIWPTHTLWENAQFIGFLMPKAVGEKLELLCSPAPKGKKMAKFLQKYPEWQPFLLSEPQGLVLRLKLAYDLLIAVEKLHKTGLYVLVDLKPENIIIQPDCSAVIVDTDSLQIVDNQLFFAANVCTPEYCPAEYYQGQDFTKIPISPTWDYFSLAVVIYRLLLGIHPFSASCKGKYQDCTSIDQLIKNGLLPVMLSLSQHFHTVPPPHNEFFKLPVLIKNYLWDSLQMATQRPNLATVLPQWYQLVNTLLVENENTKIEPKELKPVEFNNTESEINPNTIDTLETSDNTTTDQQANKTVVRIIIEFLKIRLIKIEDFLGAKHTEIVASIKELSKYHPIVSFLFGGVYWGLVFVIGHFIMGSIFISFVYVLSWLIGMGADWTSYIGVYFILSILYFALKESRN